MGDMCVSLPTQTTSAVGSTSCTKGTVQIPPMTSPDLTSSLFLSAALEMKLDLDFGSLLYVQNGGGCYNPGNDTLMACNNTIGTVLRLCFRRGKGTPQSFGFDLGWQPAAKFQVFSSNSALPTRKQLGTRWGQVPVQSPEAPRNPFGGQFQRPLCSNFGSLASGTDCRGPGCGFLCQSPGLYCKRLKSVLHSRASV